MATSSGRARSTPVKMDVVIKRNVLQDMDRPSSVNVYFTLDDFEGLKLRLKFPEPAIFVPQGQDVVAMRDEIFSMPVRCTTGRGPA